MDQIVGISFDTTAANTGRLNGPCTLLELKMQKKLLWLACRHHVLEVVCGDVFFSDHVSIDTKRQMVLRIREILSHDVE